MAEKEFQVQYFDADGCLMDAPLYTTRQEANEEAHGNIMMGRYLRAEVWEHIKRTTIIVGEPEVINHK